MYACYLCFAADNIIIHVHNIHPIRAQLYMYIASFGFEQIVLRQLVLFVNSIHDRITNNIYSADIVFSVYGGSWSLRERIPEAEVEPTTWLRREEAERYRP